MKATAITLTLGIIWLSIMFSMVYTSAVALLTTIA